MKFNQLASKEELNKLVKELLKVTNKRYQCNISENELREMLDIQEEQYLFDLTNNYEWLENEYTTDNFKHLSDAVHDEYLEEYLN